MVKFSLVLATRDRISLLSNLLQSVLSTTEVKASVEVIAVIDDDDTSMHQSAPGLMRKYSEINLLFVSRKRSEWMNRDYINYAFHHTKGENVIVLNDDTLFVNRGWDVAADKKIREYLSDKPDGVFMGMTENFNNNPRLCYFPLVSRKAVEASGFLMPPERKTWGADHDIFRLYSHPFVNRILRLPEIGIKHISHHDGNRQRDHISERMEKIHRADAGGFDVDLRANEIGSAISAKKNTAKILVVYNICGINKNENVSYYCSSINSILNQKFDGMELVVSGCATTKETKDVLLENFQDRVHFYWVDEILPLNVTMNHAVKNFTKRFGKCGGYLYVDSGVTFGDDRYVAQKMYDLMREGGCGMVAAQVDTDGGYEGWGITLKKDEHYFMRTGETVNLHCQLFSAKLFDAYGGVLPDIFASDTSESTFYYMCAAVYTKYAIHKDVFLHHAFYMDGASSGFRGKKPMLFGTKRDINSISAKGHEFGFGYEECRNPNRAVIQRNHDRAKYGKQGGCLDDRLESFIKSDIFLQPWEFDYNNVVGQFVTARKMNPRQLASPKVTCITVSHNKEDLVVEAIKSVIAQTMGDWQLIVVDSGELFDKGVFRDYEHHPKIRIVRSNETDETRRQKAMAPWCHNQCVRKGMVHGELMVYLSDDDVFYPNAFQTFVDFAENNPHAMAFYASQDMITVGHDGSRTMSGERRALTRMGKCVGRKMDCVIDYLQFCHRKSVLDNLGGVYWGEDKANESHADGVFMDRIGEFTPIYPIDTKVGQNRRTPLSTFAPSKAK